MPKNRLASFVPAVAAGVLTLAVGGTGTAGTTSGSDNYGHDRGSCYTQESTVRAFLPQITNAWADNDANAFAAVFTSDASFIVPGQDTYLTSREQIRAYMAAAFAGPLQGVRATATILNLRCLAANVAVAVTQGGLLFPGETVVPPERIGRQTWVVTKAGPGLAHRGLPEQPHHLRLRPEGRWFAPSSAWPPRCPGHPSANSGCACTQLEHRCSPPCDGGNDPSRCARCAGIELLDVRLRQALEIDQEVDQLDRAVRQFVAGHRDTRYQFTDSDVCAHRRVLRVR